METEIKRIACVTGASRGIGAEIARTLAKAGYRVVCAARSKDAIDSLAREINGLAVVMDMADRQSIESAVRTVEETWGPIDILVNNAGIASSAPCVKVEDAEWDRIIAVNLTGGFLLTRRVLSSMASQGWGRVIFIASNAGLTGYPYTSAYCASKHGVIGLMRALSAEFARTGITINALCPGFVETEMAQNAIENIEAQTQRSADDARRSLEKLNPQKRLIQVDEVAHLCLSLVDEGARGVNGQAIVIDGGQVMH